MTAIPVWCHAKSSHTHTYLASHTQKHANQHRSKRIFCLTLSNRVKHDRPRHHRLRLYGRIYSLDSTGSARSHNDAPPLRPASLKELAQPMPAPFRRHNDCNIRRFQQFNFSSRSFPLPTWQQSLQSSLGKTPCTLPRPSRWQATNTHVTFNAIICQYRVGQRYRT